MIVNIIVFLNIQGELDLSNRKIQFNGTGDVKIVWWLVGELAHGNFLPIGPPCSGFEWIKPPPDPGNFSDPEIGPLGKSLSIVDHLKDRGEWEYVLRVFYDKKIHESIFQDEHNGTILVTESSMSVRVGDGGINRGKSPVIINR